ncbi:LRR domain-containing protein [Artemisia annua]|uniref:non-specific serine/threonine protein kinase n=1 Tax=Artemisia annua TaxID=35608 RepID=A0A2U1L677_ARTAN|nr:LRR domain-containing protein [Artemisia annua]
MGPLGPDFDVDYNNPSIECNCTFDSNTTCHITKLKVSQLNRQGVILEEIAALTYLTVLKLDQNAFTGTLPTFLGNMSAMLYLSLAHNQFFGTIPKELGNLKELVMLAVSSNNFSGTLPPELGNLRKLELLWASDSPFSGKIPSFIGNWTRLSELRVSDLQNVSSSLDFIVNLRNLKDLIIRNALVSGPIPSDIIRLRNLTILDLSFNNLNGSLPQTLMNMTSLISLNLVANNFKFDSTNISTFPGLNCLQRDFACNRSTNPYTSFAIKCGGSQMRSANGILFETENSTSLGPASFHVNQDKWAVSNGGIVIDRVDPSFIASTTISVDNTRDPELFRTSRKSPGSLRYYGLGLQNGPYTISLFFAETVFNRTRNTWQGHGRRVFDIYIQGNRRQRDFDISKEAGGIARALVKDFSVTVTQNHLEIHLFWAGKGTCCIPEQGDYGPLISAIQVSPDSFMSCLVSSIILKWAKRDKKPYFHDSDVQKKYNDENGTNEKVVGFKVKSKSKKTGMIIGIVAGVASVSLLLLVFGLYMKRKSKHREEDEFLGMGPKVNTYTYSELKSATSDFSPSNLLGEGGFGPVYKGILNDGSVVAVKQLSVASHHGRSQFITEISTISAVQHWNLVKLHGSCIDGARRLLVYEYLENKSLDQALFGKTDVHLDWPTRFNICLGTAKGLAYLHEESRPRIVHRDVKASNILLDGELCPKISDFGLAKLYDDKRTHMSTRVAGTIGYLAPEYAMRGHLTSKADVFGFGVVCLEILSGRPNYDEKLDSEQKYLLQWAWSLYEIGHPLDLIDPSLASFDEEQAKRMIGVALMCVQASPSLRPAMSRVIAMLSGDVEISAVTTKPSYLTDWDFSDITNTFCDDEPTFSENTTTNTTTTTFTTASSVVWSQCHRP